MTRAFNEKSNPLLNEIFMRYSTQAIADAINVSKWAVQTWRFVPEKFIPAIAKMCDMDSGLIYDNTRKFQDDYGNIFKKSRRKQWSCISHYEEANLSMLDALRRSKNTIQLLKSRPEINDLLVNINTLEKLVDFITDSTTIKESLTFQIMREIKTSREDNNKITPISSGAAVS